MAQTFEGAGKWAWNTMSVVVAAWVLNDMAHLTPDPNYHAFGNEDAEWFAKVFAIGTLSAGIGAGAKIAKNLLSK